MIPLRWRSRARALQGTSSIVFIATPKYADAYCYTEQR